MLPVSAMAGVLIIGLGAWWWLDPSESEDVVSTSGTTQQSSHQQLGEEQPTTTESLAEAEAETQTYSALGGEMVTIPAGSFRMGDLTGNRDSNEKPVHTVTIKAFKMGKTEVSFAQWDACVADGGCQHTPDDEDWGRGNRPVINVSYNDITQQFIPWLNRKTGQRFRLPSEAEWEYAARAETQTDYPWGNRASHEYANYGKDNCCEGLSTGRDRWVNTSPVGSFPANAFGLFDMHGNVWEWVEDCWNGNYNGAPSDGRAWAQGDCGFRVLRGGSWLYFPAGLRSSNRYYYSRGYRYVSYGFRLAQDLKQTSASDKVTSEVADSIISISSTKNIPVPKNFLGADEALKISTHLDNSTLVLEWAIEQGYYIYQDFIKITAQDMQNKSIEIPFNILNDGMSIRDKMFERNLIIHLDRLEIRIENWTTLDAKELMVQFQGGSESIAFPPSKIYLRKTGNEQIEISKNKFN